MWSKDIAQQLALCASRWLPAKCGFSCTPKLSHDLHRQLAIFSRQGLATISSSVQSTFGVDSPLSVSHILRRWGLFHSMSIDAFSFSSSLSAFPQRHSFSLWFTNYKAVSHFQLTESHGTPTILSHLSSQSFSIQALHLCSKHGTHTKSHGALPSRAIQKVPSTPLRYTIHSKRTCEAGVEECFYYWRFSTSILGIRISSSCLFLTC